MAWKCNNSSFCAGCSLASVKSKGNKKRKRGQADDSDEAEDFSESDSELGEFLTGRSCCTLS